MNHKTLSQREVGKEVKVVVREEAINGVPVLDDQDHSREVALLRTFTATKRDISREIVQSIKHIINLRDSISDD